ncbi:hypothetical protein [Enemella sp. A6]|uniref:hypothetical protein n=1 Tax=Enemella sp. A6 TaxID=3440152 RepID=UPI003EB6E79E
MNCRIRSGGGHFQSMKPNERGEKIMERHEFTNKTRTFEKSTVRRNWRSIAVAGVAAMMVGGIATGSWAVSTDGAAGAAVQQPPATSPGDQPKPAEPAEDGPMPDSPSDDATGKPDELSKRPITSIPEGKWMFTHCVSEQDGDRMSVQRVFLDSDGWRWMANSSNDGTQSYLLVDPAGTQAELDALPTDRAELRKHLRSGTGGNSPTERAYKKVNELLISELATPEQAQRMIEALADGPQDEGRTIEVTDTTVDGFKAKKVTLTVAGGSPDLSGKDDTVTDMSFGMVIGTDGRVLSADSRAREGEGESWYESSCRRSLVTEMDQDVIDELGTEHKAKETY